MASKDLIKLIHVAKGQLGLEDEDYRTMIKSISGKESSKDMTDHQALNLISKLEELGFKSTNNGRNNFKAYKNREDMATPEQMRMIEAMWMSSPAVREKTRSAMCRFIKRIAGVDRIEWLRKDKVQKVVKAIEELR